jgi:threonine-phosphate decarboxylase
MSVVAMKEQSTDQSGTAMHGGRVYDASRRWGVGFDKVLDFSANINPLGPPERVLSAIENALTPVSLQTYPDDHTFVRAVINRLRVMPDEIVVGSGVTSLIFAVAHAVVPKRVLLLEPAFAEYARACTAVNAEVTAWLLNEASGFTPDFVSLERLIEQRQLDLVILNSPHNPTGNIYPSDALLSLIDVAEAHDTVVLLDEAFIDYGSQEGLLSLAPTKPHLIVLRSLTKFYAMPALRIGYAVCNTRLASMMRRQIDPWSVSTVALEAGRAALEQDEFGLESVRVNAMAREAFAEALRALGLQVFPSAANFLMVKLPRNSGEDLQHWLEPERILIRRCDSFHGLDDRFVRLAVRTSHDNMRLVSLIEQWLKGNGTNG